MNIDKIAKVKKSKPFTALDCIVIAVLAVAIAISIWLIFRRPAATVTLKTPDSTRELSLKTDAVIELEHLTVHIEGGKVWVTDADCGDKTCVHTGAISRAWQSIVCLPSGTVITINGEGELQWEIG